MLKHIIKLKLQHSNFILIFLAFSIAFSLLYYKETVAQNIKNEMIISLLLMGIRIKR